MAIQETTIHDLLKQATQRLIEAQCDTPRLDAELLLAHVLGQNRTWLYANFRTPVAVDKADFAAVLKRREKREPVAYIIGKKEFFGLSFIVSPAVLIPRPETELLVETALQIPKNPKSELTIADIGTGSGCIAISLATRLPHVRIYAIDISVEALAIARQNAQRHQVAERITFLQGDLVAPLPEPVDLLVSNPPYITEHALNNMVAPEVNQFEPMVALEGGKDGLAVIRQLLQQAKNKMKPEGCLLVEIGADQGDAAKELAQTEFPHANLNIKPDLAHRDRLLVVDWAEMSR